MSGCGPPSSVRLLGRWFQLSPTRPSSTVSVAVSSTSRSSETGRRTISSRVPSPVGDRPTSARPTSSCAMVMCSTNPSSQVAAPPQHQETPHSGPGDRTVSGWGRVTGQDCADVGEAGTHRVGGRRLPGVHRHVGGIRNRRDPARLRRDATRPGPPPGLQPDHPGRHRLLPGHGRRTGRLRAGGRPLRAGPHAAVRHGHLRPGCHGVNAGHRLRIPPGQPIRLGAGRLGSGAHEPDHPPGPLHGRPDGPRDVHHHGRLPRRPGGSAADRRRDPSYDVVAVGVRSRDRPGRRRHGLGNPVR